MLGDERNKNMKCKNQYCSDSSIRCEVGKGSFKGYKLWICSHCGCIVKMEKIETSVDS